LIPNFITHSKHQENDFFPVKIYPDKTAWLKFQCFLDTRLSLRIATMLGADDFTSKINALNICEKILTYCSSLPSKVNYQSVLNHNHFFFNFFQFHIH